MKVRSSRSYECRFYSKNYTNEISKRILTCPCGLARHEFRDNFKLTRYTRHPIITRNIFSSTKLVPFLIEKHTVTIRFKSIICFLLIKYINHKMKRVYLNLKKYSFRVQFFPTKSCRNR